MDIIELQDLIKSQLQEIERNRNRPQIIIVNRKIFNNHKLLNHLDILSDDAKITYMGLPLIRSDYCELVKVY